MSTKSIEISPEIAQLIELSSKQRQVPFKQELARNVVEQAVIAEDPELGFMVEAGIALAEITPLARSLGVNDVVINSKHIHVSVLNAQNKVTIPTILMSTRYLENGVLVVKLNGVNYGTIVGHITEQTLTVVARENSTEEIEIDFQPEKEFDLTKFLDGLATQIDQDRAKSSDLKAEEYLIFLQDRSNLPLEKQKQIISALTNPHIRENFAFIAQSKEDRALDILRDAAIWNARVEKFLERLKTKFSSLSADKLKEVVLRTGERLGGQVDHPEFRKAVLAELTNEVVSYKLSSHARAQIGALIERVYAGASALSAVKQFVTNQLTVDLAQTINDQRHGLISFANATVEEFGLAFKTLAVQPAYATHSQKENVDLDSVNEALVLLEAAKLAEEMKEIEI